MKNKYILIVSISSVIISFSYYSCNKNKDNPVGPDNFTGIAQDYFPSLPNKQMNLNVSGSITRYDTAGNVTEMQQLTNQEYKSYFSETKIFRNLNAIPYFFIDGHGNSQLVGYYANDNGNILIISKNPTGHIFTLLPNELKINDEWTITSPLISTKSQIHFKLAETLNSYTNSAGKSYQNVVTLLITFNDSTSNYADYGGGNYYTSYTKQKYNINLYLAKDIGVIEAKINNFEFINRQYTYYTYYEHLQYIKVVITGSACVL